MLNCVDDLPNEILVDGILMKLSLANRLNQQRTCRRWKALMPLKDKQLNLIPLVEEIRQLWHREDEMNLEDITKTYRWKKSRKVAVSHSFQECSSRLRSKAPKIIENCLNVLLDPFGRHHFFESVKNLEIVDRLQNWTLNIECVKDIARRLKELKVLKISGDGMIPIEEISNFLDLLKVRNLKILHLSNSGDGLPMNWLYFRDDAADAAKSIIELLRRCSKLETLYLNLGIIPFNVRNKYGRILFPTSFQELSIYDDSFPEKFRFAFFEKCHERMTKLELRISSFVDGGWMNLINDPFPALKELSVTAPIQNSGILRKLCAAYPNLKTLRIRLQYRELQLADLLSIRLLQKLTELRLDLVWYQDWIVLNSDVMAAILNPNMSKLAFEVNKMDKSALLQIANICGPKLEYFALRQNSGWEFKDKTWGPFLARCPNLCELFIDQRNLKPNAREIAANLPDGLKFLTIDFSCEETWKIIKWIQELCLERIKLNQMEKILILDIWRDYSDLDIYLQLNEILEQANVQLLKKFFIFSKGLW